MNLKEKILVLFLFLSFGLLIGILIYGMCYESINDKKEWNNGYCQCGAKWEFSQAVGHYYSTSYVYKCPNCEAIIELSEYH